MKAARFLLPFVIFFLVSFPLFRERGSAHARAQQNLTPAASAPASAPPQVAQPDPPGTIDGAKNPELIPDEVAYRLVLLAMAEPENATDAQKARFQAKVAPAGLDENDIQALFGVLAPFQTQVDSLSAQSSQILARDPIPPSGSPDYQQLVQLGQQKDTALAQAIGALPARLSSDGATKLQAFVETQKTGMKYLPEAPMKNP